jgi:hypothetical protein
MNGEFAVNRIDDESGNSCVRTAKGVSSSHERVVHLALISTLVS